MRSLFNSKSLIAFTIAVSLFSAFNIAIGIAPSKFNWPQLSVFWAAVINSFLVTIYFSAVFYFNLNGERNEKEKWADSVYYLGFILTLVALITSLSIVKMEDDAELLRATIVQNAIALSSTVWAIILRTVWKLSLPSELDELSFVEKLTAQYGELGRAVSKTTKIFASESDKIYQFSEEFQAAFQNLRSTIDAELKELEGSFSSYRSEISKNTTAHNKANKALENTAVDLQKFVDGVGEYSGQLEAVTASIMALESVISAINDTDAKLLNAIGAVQRNTDMSTAHLSEMAKSGTKSSERQALYESNALSSLKGFETTLNALRTELGNISNNINSIKEDTSVSKNTDEIRVLIEEFRNRSERFLRDFNRVQGPDGVREYIHNLWRAMWGRY